MHWFTHNEILFCFFNIISDFGSIAIHDEIIWAIGNPKKNQIDTVDLPIVGTQEMLLVVYFLSKNIRPEPKKCLPVDRNRPENLHTERIVSSKNLHTPHRWIV